MTTELKYEIDKLEEVQTRYQQMIDKYREHVRADLFLAEDEENYKKLSEEMHDQLTKIRDLANEEASYDQWLDDQKEQAEDEFMPTEGAEEIQSNNSVTGLEFTPRRLNLRCEGLADLCKERQWYTRGTAEQYAKLLQIEDKENITLKDAVEVAQDIHKHSSRGTLEEIMEAVLRHLKAYYEEIEAPERWPPAEEHTKENISELISREEDALGKIHTELEGINTKESIMICGLEGMLLHVIQNVPDLQKAVIESEKTAIDCLCCLMEALAQEPTKFLKDMAPWGKLAIPDLSRKSVEEIVRSYYSTPEKELG